MTPERFALVTQIYHRALECEPSERVAFLDQKCGRDRELRRDVELLLTGGKNAEATLLSMAMQEAVKRLSDETPRSLVGETLDHYQVLSIIGVGGMGEVYRARDINLGREVAIKLLPSTSGSGSERLRLVREARAASALNHPNILTIHEIGQTNEHHFIVAEFIEGETLRQRIAQGRIELGEALSIAIQVASALSAAHAAGIVHRDIKPENIIIRRDDLVKVLDFGLAKLTDTTSLTTTPDEPTMEWFHTDANVVLGTSAYMSPEQTRGLPIDQRTDIWSLGVVLYEMVTGSLPFTGGTKSDVLVAILGKDPPDLTAETPQRTALKKILDKSLSKDRDSRYQTARELLDDLRVLKDTVQGQTTGGTPLPSSGVLQSKAFRRTAILALFVGVAGLGVFTFNRFNRGKPGEPAPLRARTTPFTTFSGREQQPTFSPDGTQIAFAWNGERGTNFDIYIKLVNSEARPLQLTSHPADDVYPAWSPDGRQVAFVRHEGSEITIFAVSVLGGPERKLYSTRSALFSFYEFGNSLSWTPDGKNLAFSGQSSPKQPNAIFLLSTETLEARKITTPPEGFLGDSTPAFSPDGKLLAFVRGASSRDVEIYVMPATGGDAKRLTIDNRSSRSLAWTGDSQWIVFASWSYGGLRLWKVPAAGGTPEQLQVGSEFASTLAISPRGDRLAYSQEFRDTNIWRLDISNTRSTPTRVVSSTRQDFSPQYSNDNSKIVFTSGRTGSNEIWLCDADGQNAQPLTSFGGPDVGSPRWSPDNAQIAFDSLSPGHRDIFIVGLNGGKPRRLTGDNYDNVRPSWSRDGKWIYFGSNRTGNWQLWKSPVDGGQAVQVTKQGGREGIESLDGKFVYYSKGFGVAGIWKTPIDGGEETLVVDGVYQGFWALLEKGIYFVNPNATPRAVINFFDFATSRMTKIAEVEKDLQLVYPSMAVSSDGKSLLFVQSDSFESDIMLVEDFH